MGLGKDGLRELLATRGGTQVNSNVNEMVDVLLKHEARCQQELKEHEAKTMELLKKKKELLDSKSGPELKELCSARGLSSGVNKEELVQRLLRAASECGEIDAAIMAEKRAA